MPHIVHCFPDKNNQVFIFVSLVLILCYNLLLGLQGFDMCDEGWVTTGYQQIFSDPLSVKYLFLYYNTQLMGGFANLLCGGLGIWGFRVLSAITLTCVGCGTFWLLKTTINRWAILIGLFLAMFCCDFGIMVFHHNYLSALFAVFIACFLYVGIINSHKRSFLLAGFLYGLDVFVRLPNATIGLLILAIALMGGQDGARGKQILKMLLYAIAGFLGAIIFEFFMMKALGHEQIFISSISDMLSAGKDTDSTHNMSSMFKTYINDYKQVLKVVVTIVIANVLFLKIGKMQNKILATIAWLAIALFAILALRNISKVYLLYGFCTTMLLASFYYLRNDRRVKVLSVLALIYMYSQVLGSDLGIGNMGSFCLYWVLPYSVGILLKMLHPQIDAVKRLSFGLFLALGLLYSGNSVAHIMGGCYFDAGSRLEKRYLIDNPLATTYTTKRNVELLNPLLHELSRYVKPNDYLLCFQSIPMVHFLTQTRPYLYNPWVWSYDPSNLQKQINIAEREHSKLPVIVRDKSHLPKWYEYDPNWNNENYPDDYIHKKKRVICINEFIKQHHYRVVWENEVFQILSCDSIK